MTTISPFLPHCPPPPPRRGRGQGSPLRALFGLLLWDAIFADDVPGVFVSRFQVLIVERDLTDAACKNAASRPRRIAAVRPARPGGKDDVLHKDRPP